MKPEGLVLVDIDRERQRLYVRRVSRFRDVPCKVDGSAVATVEVDGLVVRVRPKGSRRVYTVTMREMAEMVCWRAAKETVAAQAPRVRRRR